ncbi:flavoprotein [Kitasatospora sp. NBC_01300]|uniref:flavoprotein n=1 Tax=Kitasatospora sp. NBC_01300 TaxID=2903574 RepID=UPI00352FB5E6|nr:Cypemycin decarboxylase [Kitasatospora sp. NBC_01300]
MPENTENTGSAANTGKTENTGNTAGAGNQEIPDLGEKRILFVVTGSINASLTPYWLHWLRQSFPRITSDLLVTRSAQRFVTLDALRRLVDGDVWTDDYADPSLPESAHVEIGERVDAFAVFPATLDFAMRLASGNCNTPATMALQITEKPIVLATAFPAGNAVVEHHMELLLRRPNVSVSRTVAAYSVGKRKWEGETGFYLPSVLKELEGMFDAEGRR